MYNVHSSVLPSSMWSIVLMNFSYLLLHVCNVLVHIVVVLFYSTCLSVISLCVCANACGKVWKSKQNTVALSKYCTHYARARMHAHNQVYLLTQNSDLFTLVIRTSVYGQQNNALLDQYWRWNLMISRSFTPSQEEAKINSK